MPKSKKSKTSKAASPEPVQTCILHVEGIVPGCFTSFNKVKGPAQDKLVQLHSIRDRRQSEPYGSLYRMDDVCASIPENLAGADLESLGYHRGCYQHFTNHLDRLQSDTASNVGSTPLSSRSPRKTPSYSTPQLFPPECIFCAKVEVKTSGKTERCQKFPVFKDKDGTLKHPTWKQIEPRALELGMHHLHRMVQGEDLFAREANFHQSCRKTFNLKYTTHIRDAAQSTNRTMDTDQDRKAAAHSNAFTVVVSFVQNVVIVQKEVVQLASLRHLYIEELERNGFPNPEYRSEKLKTRLENDDINEFIAFAKINPGDKGCITYNLVYSTSISVAEAVVYAYKIGSKDKYEDVALLLRGIIQQAFKDSKSLPWPPTADDLDVKSSEELLPPDLVKFLNFVIAGDGDVDHSEKTKRIVLSIGQV